MKMWRFWFRVSVSLTIGFSAYEKFPAFEWTIALVHCHCQVSLDTAKTLNFEFGKEDNAVHYIKGKSGIIAVKNKK